MGIKLYENQLEAVNKLHNGSILYADTGNGKTITSLAYYWKCQGGDIESNIYLPLKHTPKDLYIITTAKKRDSQDWEKEMRSFLLSTHSDVCGYSNKVVVDSWNNIKKYDKVTGSFFIFDEDKVCGDGVWAKTFIKIARNNEWILCTATPGDTWKDYIPVFLANGFYRNKTDFYNQHVVWKRFSKFPDISHYINTNKLTYLRNLILVYMKDAKKTVKHHITETVGYDIKAYKQVYKDRWNIYDNCPIINASEMCYLQRKIVNSSEERQARLMEIIEKLSRVVIFYNFDYELEILKSLYYGDRVVAEWNGHAHQPIPDCNRWVYLVQYTAGSEAWNCIKTDTIIFYSQHYSYKVMHQAEGRIDRLNTPYSDLFYYHLTSKSPIDVAIARAVKNKEIFNESYFVAGKY